MSLHARIKRMLICCLSRCGSPSIDQLMVSCHGKESRIIKYYCWVCQCHDDISAWTDLPCVPSHVSAPRNKITTASCSYTYYSIASPLQASYDVWHIPYPHTQICDPRQYLPCSRILFQHHASWASSTSASPQQPIHLANCRVSPLRLLNKTCF